MEKRIDGFGSLSFVGSPKVFAVSAKTWRVLVLVLCCAPLLCSARGLQKGKEGQRLPQFF